MISTHFPYVFVYDYRKSTMSMSITVSRVDIAVSMPDRGRDWKCGLEAYTCPAISMNYQL